MYSLRESKNVVEIRLERKLRYDFAKLKAKGRLRSLYKSYNPEGVSAPQQPTTPAAPAAPDPYHDMVEDLSADPPTN